MSKERIVESLLGQTTQKKKSRIELDNHSQKHPVNHPFLFHSMSLSDACGPL